MPNNEGSATEYFEVPNNALPNTILVPNNATLIKKWIFSNSTRKGQLKNVQDGIFRPQGDREIQETSWG